MLVPTVPGTAPSPFASVAETHSGVVFFVGDRAYKLKKPVKFDFLDFSTREARRTICHREVALNRRLAPDVYLGVADVNGPDGEPLDHLVVMRRLREDRRLSTLVRAGVPLDDELRRLARVLAAFHARADTSPQVADAASRESLGGRWEANHVEMAQFADSVLDRDVTERVVTLARRYLAGRGPLFAGRVRDGRARDGHGDLLAEDIFCLDDGPRVLDCLEFDDRLRWDDVLADVAFLAMDLERLGRRDLADRFLDDYREFTADNWPHSLADHHIAYRAHVRAKVACLRWEQGDEGSAAVARHLLTMAKDHLERGRVRLLVIGGLPGTGKSTIATAVADALGAVVLRADEIRKQLAGLDPATPAAAAVGQGIYTTASTAATYATLLDRARECLVRGETAVLDASWTDPAHRDAARQLAIDADADLDELRCVLRSDLADARLAARSARGGDPSDATAQVAHAMAAADISWPTATTIDTEPPVDAVREAVFTALDIRPPY